MERVGSIEGMVTALKEGLLTGDDVRDIVGVLPVDLVDKTTIAEDEDRVIPITDIPAAPTVDTTPAEGYTLTEHTINQLFRHLKISSGVERVYPHLLRHTFATSYMMGGGNLEYLRILMGHTDYNVTRNYLHLASQFQLMGADIYKLDAIFFQKGY